MTHTCPTWSMPICRAARALKISSATCISQKWLPAPCVASWGSPRFLARALTFSGSAESIRPYSSQCSLSSAHA
eukprot:CAMPEP_0206065692 /NCGR_PEP_ID=MMETSP1466-20131121/59357_1 /ASSEMBLY_ACC=CAM_ASM_001126 /TAXON_ID=44452 /ORGANISM="Pavlova gyrans, Strain CCMP608" /LENGTH=73 /DNA_ID=CAMNT_0053441067 /DNA_START=750 /DNA_END=971 /DNA_ORIENTATION=-